MEKNSFTLIETLLSLIIISVIISGFTKFINNPTNLSTYNNLQTAHNDFLKTGNISDYEQFQFNK
ncbi:MAG: prepilin-type N-terminal cleavage/methylation domain-containing protein [Arcobacteraceae bacterium]|nr:prepilin-type N-terminal cleavage/methylation domain-containing protein [Arcobacteraceae bacterium]